MSIVFAIDEVGTFAYLEPLFLKWLEEKKDGWGIIVGSDILNFPRYKAIESLLPSNNQATSNITTLVSSLGKLSNNIKELHSFSHEKNLVNIGIFDVWDKSWNIEDTSTTHFFVIDKNQSEKLTRQHPSIDIKIIGQPAWEAVPKLTAAPENTVLFIGQPIEQHYENTLGYDENSAWQLLCSAVKGTDYTLSYALHPAQNNVQVADNIQLYTNINQALAKNSIIISPFSSALFDAWLGGNRNVISLQPNITATADKCYLSRMGLIPYATSAKSLQKLLGLQPFEIAENPFLGSLSRLEKELGILT